MALGALLLVAWRRPDLGVLSLVLLLPFQQFILARVFAMGIDPRAVALLRLWKEFVVILLVARLSLVAKHRWDGLDRLVIVFLGFVALYLVLPIGPPLYARLLGARSVALFLVLFLAARHLRLPSKTFDRVEIAVLVAACVLVGFAFWNSFAPEAFGHWVISVGVPQYWAAILGGGGAPIVFLGSAEGAGFVRAGSLLLGPTALAYYMLIPLALVLARVVTGTAQWWHLFVGALGVAGVVLTLTRSAIALLPLMIALAFVAGRKRGTLGVGVLVVAIAVAPLASSIGVSSRVRTGFDLQDSSTAAHVTQLTQSRERILENPFGTGLASAGALSRRFDVAKSITNESWYLQVGTELGVLGMVLYAGVVLVGLRYLWRRARNGSGLGVAGLCALSPIAAGGLVLHNLEEHAIGWTLWILLGLALRRTSDETAVEVDAARSRVAA